jgi:hypothetical protein
MPTDGRSGAPTARALLLVLGLTVGPATAGAEEFSSRAPGSLRAAVAARISASDLRRAVASEATPPATQAPHKPFFKTGRGIAAAVLMAGGLGWLVYSQSHDRVKSPGNN